MSKKPEKEPKKYQFENKYGQKITLLGETSISDLVQSGVTGFRFVRTDAPQPLLQNEWRCITPNGY
jgi:hypothetical protein